MNRGVDLLEFSLELLKCPSHCYDLYILHSIFYSATCTLRSKT